MMKNRIKDILKLFFAGIIVFVVLLCVYPFSSKAVTDTTWQSYYCYELDEENSIIKLRYFWMGGDDLYDIVIPAKAVIGGKEYSTVIYPGHDHQHRFFKYDNIASFSVEKGVKLGEGYYAHVEGFFSYYTINQNGASVQVERKNLKRIDVSNLDTSGVTHMESFFALCENVESIDLRGLDFSKVQDMSGMFMGCTNLKTVNMSGLSLTNEEYKNRLSVDMRFMFSQCENLTNVNLNDIKIDENDFYKMDGLFYYCKKLRTIDLSSFAFARDEEGFYDGKRPIVLSTDFFTKCDSLVAIKTPKSIYYAPYSDVIDLPTPMWTEEGGEEYTNLNQAPSSTWIYAVDKDRYENGDDEENNITNNNEDEITHISENEGKDVPEGYVKLFRFYNPNSGEHFYTGSILEGNNLIDAGWTWEGTGWIAPKEGTPVYRLYNPNAGDHHYTTSEKERANLIKAGWNDEGIAWRTNSEGTPLYRLYNPNAVSGAHHYTQSEKERDNLINTGWQYEGIGWYGK